MPDDNTIIASIKLLISRLEHLSADSRYAHRASGLRGSLWKWVERLETKKPCEGEETFARLKSLMAQGYEILVAAAREINAPEK